MEAVRGNTSTTTETTTVRFVFKLLAAATQASFVTFNTAANGRNVFEPESVVAIVIYLLVGWGLASLVRVVTRGSAAEG